MAGDWIKMRVGLTTNPHVLRIAENLLDCGEFVEWAGLSWGIEGYPPPSKADMEQERYVALRVTRYVTVTALLKFWGYANEHAKGDSIDGIRPQDVLEITGVPGFATALQAAGWAEFDLEKGGVRMPNFDEHNTGARERTSAGAERQKRYRERKKAASGSDVTRDVTVTEREEKRREEITLSKDKGASAPEPDAIFGTGLSYLMAHGASEKGARGFLGKMRGAVGDLTTAELLAKAQAQQVSDPLAWLRAAAGRKTNTGRTKAGVAL